MIRLFRAKWAQAGPLLALLIVLSAGLASPVWGEDEAFSVDAGPDLFLIGGGGPVSVDLAAVVNQDPSFVEFLWFRVDGPGLITFTPDDEDLTLATFPVSGIYTVRVRVENLAGEIAFDDVIVSVGPIIVKTQVTRVNFKAFGAGIPKSSLSFKMYGADTGDRRLDLQAGDVIAVALDAVEVGRLNVPQDPDDDFFTMDFFGRARPSNEKTGDTFDAELSSSFKRVKLRYRNNALGQIAFKASGGDFDSGQVPGATATPVPITVSVITIRAVSGVPLQTSFENDVGVVVKDRRGVLRGKAKP